MQVRLDLFNRPVSNGVEQRKTYQSIPRVARDTVSFSGGLVTVAKEFDIPVFQKSGEKFLENVKAAPDVKAVLALYREYVEPFKDYMYPSEASERRKIMRHEWGNTSGAQVKLLEIYAQKNKEMKSEDLYKSARKIVKLNNSLLTAYQDFKAGAVKDTEHAFRRAFHIAKKYASDKKITVNIDLENLDILGEIKKNSDPFKDYVIFSNVIGNAVKYSKESSVVDVKFIKDTESEPGKIKYLFSVSDRGIGIPPEDHEKVLEYKGRASNVGKIHGTGQGFNDVVKAAGGKHNIKIESPLYPDATEFKGTKITVVLHEENA